MRPSPVVVTAVAMYFAFALVGLNNTLTGLVLAHTVLSAPYVLITVLATLQPFDRDLLKAAATLGPPTHAAFFRVFLAQIAPNLGPPVPTLIFDSPTRMAAPSHTHAPTHTPGRLAPPPAGAPAKVKDATRTVGQGWSRVMVVDLPQGLGDSTPTTSGSGAPTSGSGAQTSGSVSYPPLTLPPSDPA